MATALVLDLQDIDKQHTPQVGGKNSSLGEMVQRLGERMRLEDLLERTGIKAGYLAVVLSAGGKESDEGVFSFRHFT